MKDRDILKLQPIPGVSECLDGFKTFWLQKNSEIGEWGLSKRKERVAEVAEFREALVDVCAGSILNASHVFPQAIAASQKESSGIVAKFMAARKQVA